MENSSTGYYYSGEIKGVPREERNKTNKNRNQYIINKIKDEMNSKFNNFPDLYIYTRHSNDSNIFRIYVVLSHNSVYNKRNKDINYLIVVLLGEYPKNPPMVFCLTEFNKHLDIFDMRNIQKNLIPEWNNNCTVNDLIVKLPSFTDNVDYQVSNKLLPDIGEYIIETIYYNLNDFLLNPNNKFFRVEILSNHSSDGKNKFYETYLIITKTNLIFLRPEHGKKKNICYIQYIININGIERLRRFLKEGEDFEGLSCFKIINNKYIDNKYNMNGNLDGNRSIFSRTVCIEEKNLNMKEINDLINLRKTEIRNNFKYFENSQSNDVKEIEQIIGIKENIIKYQIDENIFYQIHELYNKLIEISSNKDNIDFSVYVKKLQIFLDKYDKIKKRDKTSDNNNYGVIKTNYDFGFE